MNKRILTTNIHSNLKLFPPLLFWNSYIYPLKDMPTHTHNAYITHTIQKAKGIIMGQTKPCPILPHSHVCLFVVCYWFHSIF